MYESHSANVIVIATCCICIDISMRLQHIVLHSYWKSNVISIVHEQRFIEISILRRWNSNGDFSIRNHIYWYIHIFALHSWFWGIVNATTSYWNCNEGSIEKAMLFQHKCNDSILKIQWNINMFSMTRHLTWSRPRPTTDT